MPVYEYLCRNCRGRMLSSTRAQTMGPCPYCTGGELKRKFSFNPTTTEIDTHFNNSIGKPVTNMRDFRDKLKIGAEEYYNRTGITTNPQPIDYSDRVGLGVTNEGLDSTNAARKRRGLPEV